MKTDFLKDFILFAGFGMLLSLFGFFDFLKTTELGIEFLIGGTIALLIKYSNDHFTAEEQQGK